MNRLSRCIKQLDLHAKKNLSEMDQRTIFHMLKRKKGSNINYYTKIRTLWKKNWEIKKY